MVCAMDNVWGLCSDPVVHPHGSLSALLSGPASACLHCVLVNSLNLSARSKPETSSLSNKPICGIGCLKFPVKWCKCVPWCSWLLLASTAPYHLSKAFVLAYRYNFCFQYNILIISVHQDWKHTKNTSCGHMSCGHHRHTTWIPVEVRPGVQGQRPVCVSWIGV